MSPNLPVGDNLTLVLLAPNTEIKASITSNKNLDLFSIDPP